MLFLLYKGHVKSVVQCHDRLSDVDLDSSDPYPEEFYDERIGEDNGTSLAISREGTTSSHGRITCSICGIEYICTVIRKCY